MSGMHKTQMKWLVYTVLVGLVPIFLRLGVWFIVEGDHISLVVPSDIVAFGFVLHISITNEIEHVQGEQQWKTAVTGVNTVFLVLYSCFAGLLIASSDENKFLDVDNTLILVIFLAFVSLGVGFTVFFKLISAHHTEQSQP